MEQAKQMLKVLYLEDSLMDQELMRERLEDEFDLTIEIADNKADYLALLNCDKQIDLILSDYNLPDCDAVEALDIAKQNCPRVPFICVSGTIGEEKAVELLKRGATDYVLKDRMVKLVTAIKRALKEAEEQRLLAQAQQELEKYLEELKAAKDRAEESDRLKTAFLANMSHEIRTPLNGILGFSDLLVNSPSQGNKELYASTIQQSGNQLLRIIDSVLDISLIESGQIVIQNTQVEVKNKLQYLHAIYESEFEKKGIRLIPKEISSDIGYIQVDEVKFSQVFSNLLSNALKFTRDGFVEYGVERKKSMLEFYVRDAGIGIPKEKERTIFERFRQVDESTTRTVGGAGLGLPIAKSYVEAMGGKMWLESTVGEGSTFYFTLPLEP
ncbi:MAG TPA: ATP-binding protein [Sunxiuqinia sp.]|nr:ATP-binding protein [Sunxiuqinia sp.]